MGARRREPSRSQSGDPRVERRGGAGEGVTPDPRRAGLGRAPQRWPLVFGGLQVAESAIGFAGGLAEGSPRSQLRHE